MNKTTKIFNFCRLRNSFRISKKAIMYEFIVRLIIAIVMVVAAIYIGKSFFRLSDSGLDSYNNLVETIESIEDGEIRSLPLILDEETAILGFTKNKDRIRKIQISSIRSEELHPGLPKGKTEDMIYTLEEFFIDHVDKVNKYPAFEGFHFKRPDSCSLDKACVCLCRQTSKNLQEKTYVCEGSLICKEVENIDFLKHSNVYQLGSVPSEQTGIKLLKITLDANDWDLVDNGFILERCNTKMGCILLSEEVQKRLQTVYIEKQGNTVAVCMESPCIPSDFI